MGNVTPFVHFWNALDNAYRLADLFHNWLENWKGGTMLFCLALGLESNNQQSWVHIQLKGETNRESVQHWLVSRG